MGAFSFSPSLLQLPLRRGLGPRRALVPVTGLVLFALVAARLVRGQAHPADSVLLETVGAVVIPLAAVVLVRATLAGRSVGDAGAPLLFFGASRRSAATAQLLVATFLAAAVAALATLGALLVVHAAQGDIVRSSALAALAGAAYGALFTAGASFGSGGGGAIVVLVLDAVVGVGDSAAAVLTPRAHLRALFGGVGPADLSSRASCAALVVMIVFGLFVVNLRARPPR
jgi:hypothetical protein